MFASCGRAPSVFFLDSECFPSACFFATALKVWMQRGTGVLHQIVRMTMRVASSVNDSVCVCLTGRTTVVPVGASRDPETFLGAEIFPTTDRFSFRYKDGTKRLPTICDIAVLVHFINHPKFRWPSTDTTATKSPFNEYSSPQSYSQQPSSQEARAEWIGTPPPVAIANNPHKMSGIQPLYSLKARRRSGLTLSEPWSGILRLRAGSSE